MSFASFPEQQPVVEMLQRSLGRGRLAHAYLFSGIELGEMEGLARTLAKTLNCANPSKRAPNGQALECCDMCLTCRRIDSGNHPDVQWVRPESKLRVVTIKQVRELIQMIEMKPTDADYKVAVIVGADRMNHQAANAFLKTLEEPPNRSILILLTTSVERVLETILSRCLRLHFAGEPGARLDPETKIWLENLTNSLSQPQKSLMGRYRLLSVITEKLGEIKATTEKQIEASSPLSKYSDVEKDTKDKWEAELDAAVESEYRRKRMELLLLFQWWLRDVWLASLNSGTSEYSLPQLSGATQRVAQRLSPREAADNLHQLERLQRQLGTNVQESLTLEVSLLKLRL